MSRSHYRRGTVDDLPRSGRFIATLCLDWDYGVHLDSRSFYVRMRHGGEPGEGHDKGWASWREGKFHGAQIMRRGDIPRSVKLRDIKTWLTEGQSIEEETR